MIKKLLSILMLGGTCLATQAIPVDFDKIRSWAGEGENRAALVVTNDAGASDPRVYVWGYKWPAGETRTGDDMFKAICQHNDNLVLLTQITGMYGSTVCGIGVGEADKLLDFIYFDFDAALKSDFIKFDYYSKNSFFGQKEAPGDNTPTLCAEAISKAKDLHTHVIQHPLDQPTYGYPAYDYDCWLFKDEGWDYGWWTSAWYGGYWSYWTASDQSEDWNYSGTGFTGRQLSNGAVDAWSFTQFDDPKVGGVGEGNPPSSNLANYVYCEEPLIVGVEGISESVDLKAEYYDISGMKISGEPTIPGIYIVRKGNRSYKILKK